MEYLTNCKNCNAPLYYGEKPFTKCQYCGTEYHYDKIYKKTKMIDIDNNIAKQIDERTIEIELYGKKKRFYISEIEINPITIADFYPVDLLYTLKPLGYKSILKLVEI